MADLKQFKLPDVGEGLTEADILSWRVAVGDTVERQPDPGRDRDREGGRRAAVAVRRRGHRAAVAEGETVDVGRPIITIDAAAAGGAGGGPTTAPPTAAQESAVGSPREDSAVGDMMPAPADPHEAPPTIESPGRQRYWSGTGRPPKVPPDAGTARPHRHTIRAGGVQCPARSVRRAPAIRPAGPAPAGAARTDPRAEPGLRAPGAGQAAGAQAGQDPRRRPGRRRPHRPGRHGVARGRRPLPPTVAGEPDSPARNRAARETRIPIKGVRKHTAAAMVSSAFTAPHVTEFVTVRRHRDDGAARPGRRPARVPRRQGSARCCSSPRR